MEFQLLQRSVHMYCTFKCSIEKYTVVFKYTRLSNPLQGSSFLPHALSTPPQTFVLPSQSNKQHQTSNLVTSEDVTLHEELCGQHPLPLSVPTLVRVHVW